MGLLEELLGVGERKNSNQKTFCQESAATAASAALLAAVAGVAGDVGGKVSCGEKSVRTGPAAVRPSLASTYGERMQALAAISRPDYPVGMILWLGEAYPHLYAELTERLPAEIHRLRSEHAPHGEFQGALDLFVKTHRQACALYRAHLLACQEPASERS